VNNSATFTTTNDNILETKLKLPQFDTSNKDQRLAYLKAMQSDYAFSLTYNGQIATVNELPKREERTLDYNVKLAKNLAGTLTSMPSLAKRYFKFSVLKRPFKKYSDYLFFKNAPFPNVEMRDNFWDNQYLGYQRLAGMNPVVIEGVNADNPIPSTFKVTASDLGMSEEEFSQAFDDDRFYMTNYAMLKDLVDQPGTVEGLRKYVTPAIALYWLNDEGQLDIKAIQFDVTEDTNAENPVITPENPRWRSARTVIQAADGTHQELWTHATRIHYVLESIIMVSHRQLAEQHPLFALLEPHLKFTLSVNVNPLFQPDRDGTIPDFGKMFACNNDALVNFMGRGMNEYSFKEYTFPNDIKNRHMENPKLVYPYRDDGKHWWKESQRFAFEYLSYYYPNDDAIKNDFELQAWAEELGGAKTENKCGLTDFPQQFTNVKQLAEIVGHIIFITTAHHASIHYPQYECAGYPPNLPFSSYLPPMTPPEEYETEEDIMKFFPRYSMAFEQAFIFYLTNFKVNKVGQYELDKFDTAAQNAIKTHQNKIVEIGREIDKANGKRKYPYPYMHPNNVPNSVTV